MVSPAEGGAVADPLASSHPYDELANWYDDDPEGVLGAALNKAHQQVLPHLAGREPLRVPDIGIGTGLFAMALSATSERPLEITGVDPSSAMLERAKERLPCLTVIKASAADVSERLPASAYDLVCTHFLSAYVPTSVLAAAVNHALAPGGLWSYAGSTMQGFWGLRRKAASRLIQRLSAGRLVLRRADPASFRWDLHNPTDADELYSSLASFGFGVAARQTYRPHVLFRTMDELMAFGHRGGWLTKPIEDLGLDQLSALERRLISLILLPEKDRMDIEIALLSRTADGVRTAGEG